MREMISFRCPRCGNGVFNPEPTGWACVICGHFQFKKQKRCALLSLWTQVKTNMQFIQLDNWGGKDLFLQRTWALIAEVEPVDLAAFKRYAYV